MGLGKTAFKKKHRLRLKVNFSLKVLLLYNVLISAIQQSESAICICMSPLERASHPSSQSTKLSSLCCTAASHWLSVLHMGVCICQCYSLNSLHRLLFHAVSTSLQNLLDCLSLLFGLPGFAPYLRLEGNCAHYVTLAGKECSSEHLGEESAVLERAPRCFLTTCMQKCWVFFQDHWFLKLEENNAVVFRDPPFWSSGSHYPLVPMQRFFQQKPGLLSAGLKTLLMSLTE